MKGNVDGAISNANRSAAAAIFRSEYGNFLGASAMVVEGALDPSCAEAMACREALFLRQDINVNAAIIASDCSSVVKAIEQGSRGENAMLIGEIRRMMAEPGEVVFRHESRYANVDAHNIARNSLNLSPGRHLWLSEPPGYVNSFVSD